MPAVGSLACKGSPRRQEWVWHGEQCFVALAPEISMSKSGGGVLDFLNARFSKVAQNSAFLPVYSSLTPVLAIYNANF